LDASTSPDTRSPLGSLVRETRSFTPPPWRGPYGRTCPLTRGSSWSSGSFRRTVGAGPGGVEGAYQATIPDVYSGAPKESGPQGSGQGGGATGARAAVCFVGLGCSRVAVRACPASRWYTYMVPGA